MLGTHASRLERWLGKDEIEALSASMREWYGPPIALAGVPGRVYACGGGDFRGPIIGGRAGSLIDFAGDRARRALRRWARNQRRTLNTGFASLSDLISEATTGGKQQNLMYAKVGTTGVVNFSNSLWRVGNVPVSAAASAALAAGTHNNNTTVGALGQIDPSGGDTLHLTTWTSMPSVGTNFLMLYDRLWNGLIALSSSAVQTCTLTGYPAGAGRYSDAAGSPGNFAFVANEAGATLSAVAHNWTMVYTDQGGTTGNSTGAVAGISGAITNRIDHAQWALPLVGGDTGIQDIESIQCSVATVAAGAPTIVLAHPLAIIPQPIANIGEVLDGINSAFNLVEIKTDAALAFMEMVKGATTATTYSGMVTTVAG